MKKILFVTDLYYEAKDRYYYEEDLFLTSKLREDFNIMICHPEDTEDFENCADLIVFRNAGPVTNFKEKYWNFRKRVVSNNLKTYNSFDGKGDMNGKQYLIDLTNFKFPVIPTIDNLSYLEELPNVTTYVIKPKDGADSIGMKFLSKDELIDKVNINDNNMLIQPLINFEYEISFYFIDNHFQYALYAPDKNKRWELKEFNPSQNDLIFAQKFINWNNLKWGIQRVDACRCDNGELLLVELEDLNPYLSLLELKPEICNEFIKAFKVSLNIAM